MGEADPGSRSRSAVTPPPKPPRPGPDVFIALDWRGHQLVGIEILDASIILPANPPGRGYVPGVESRPGSAGRYGR